MTNQSFCKILMMKDLETSNGTIVGINQLHQLMEETLSVVVNGVLLFVTKVKYSVRTLKLSDTIRDGRARTQFRAWFRAGLLRTSTSSPSWILNPPVPVLRVVSDVLVFVHDILGW